MFRIKPKIVCCTINITTWTYIFHLTMWKVYKVYSHSYSIKLGHMNITSICIPVYEVGLDYLKACSILYLLLYFHISICMYHIFINHPDQGWTSLITFDLCCKISSFLLELSRHFTLNLFFFSLDLFTTFRSRKVQFQSCLK